MARTRLIAHALLVLTALIWGVAFVAQRSGMELIEPMTFNAARMALAAMAVATRRRERGTGPAVKISAAVCRNTWLGGLCCGTFLGAASIFQQMGLVYTDAGKAGFITTLYILLVPVIRFAVFRKKQARLVWLAVAMGVLGLYLLCVTQSFTLTRGDALLCVCAFLFSGHILCCDHFAPRGWLLGICAVQFAVASALSWLIALFAETPTWDKLVSAAVPILYCGLLSGGVGYTLQMFAQKHTDPTVASLLMSLEAVFAAAAGALLLGERMSARELIGCAIMFAAIIIIQFQKNE